MLLRAKLLGLEAKKPIVILNKEDAAELGVRALDRIELDFKKKRLISIVNVAEKFIKKGEIGLYGEIQEKLKIKNKTEIKIIPAEAPESLDYIRNKLIGRILKAKEIKKIVEDVVNQKLSEIELTAFIISLHNYGMTMDEAAALSEAMVATGERLDLGKKEIYDKHSIGSCPGDKTSILLVPIIAAAGLIIPKTSSRAITSASVSYDTPIIIQEKKKIKLTGIGDFTDKIIDNSREMKKHENGTEYVEFNSSNYSVPVFDRKLRISFKPLTGVYRHPSPSTLLEVTMEGNRKVTVTSDHSLFILKNRNIISLPTSEIRAGNFVVVPRDLNEKNNINVIDLIEELKEILPNDQLDKIFVKGFDKKLFRDIRKNSSTNNMRYYRGSIPMSLFLNKKTSIDKIKIKFKYGKVEIPAKINVTADLMRLLGYFIAEGGIRRHSVCFYLGSNDKEMEIANDIKKCTRSVFKVEASKTRRPSRRTETDIYIYGKIIAIIFKHIFKTGDNVYSKKIPSIVFNVSNELKKEFLNAYLKGDGCKRTSIYAGREGVTVSKELATGIQYLATCLGTSCSVYVGLKSIRYFPTYTSVCKKNYRLYFPKRGKMNYTNMFPIRDGGLLNFVEKYKELVNSPHNKWKLYHMILNQNRISFEVLKRSMQHLYQTNGDCDNEIVDLIKLMDSDLGFIKIKSIRKIKSKHRFVYDLCVKGYENFVGGFGPVFLHNSGTADRFECLAPVELSLDEIKNVVNKTNGCLVWGGAVDLAPADDIFIQIEYPLSLDPLLLPSVMGKKKAVGVKYLVIDIPTGRGTKIKTIGEAERLANQFIELGKKLNINVKGASTYGEQPLGYAIGPALEAREALEAIISGKGAEDLIDKATHLAGILIGFKTGKNTKSDALRLLKSGKVYKKLKEIIAEQGGDAKIKPSDIGIGPKKAEVRANVLGNILWINNQAIAQITRAAGAPKDKGAGILLHKKIWDKVEYNEILFEIYAEKTHKLNAALKLANELNVIGIGKKFDMLLKKIPSFEERKYFILER